MSAKLKIDPEFHALLTPLLLEEREELESELKADGCRDPIVVWGENGENVLVDGHNRFEICQKYSIPFQTVTKDFSDRDSVKVWIIHHQFARRNLTPYTRAELALKLESIIAAKAKKNQQVRKGEQPGATFPNSGNLNPLHVDAELAKVAKVGKDTIHRVRAISEKADEETKEKLRRGELSINETYKKVKKPALKPPQTPPPLPKGVYDVIYADPPWRYHTAPPDRADAIEAHYPTLSDEEICAQQIPSAPDSVLFLWATAPKLKDALSVMESWGFEYKTCAVWDKEWIGLGYWFRGEHELLLVGTKGNVSPPPKEVRESSMFRERRGEHSRKPEWFYQLIEKYMPGRKHLELFGRPNGKAREGWTVWGNENAG